MATNIRQRRIAELLFAAGAEKRTFEREHSVVSRTSALEDLCRIRRGLGRPTRLAAKRLLLEIQQAAKARLEAGQFTQDDFQAISRRLEDVRARLKAMPKLRAEHKKEKQRLRKAMNPTDEERRKLLDEAHPPFEEPKECEWYRDVVKGTVVWTLAVPFEPFNVICKKELENVGTISTEAA